MKVKFMILGIGLVFSSYGFAEELISLKDFLKAELTSSKLAKETFSITSEQKKALEQIATDNSQSSFTFYYAKSAEGQLEKACTLIPQQGKEGPMVVGVCFEPKGLINQVKILSHEEERGKKITEVAFLKQFSGKKVSDAFQVGQDVDGISGATWSSKAVSEALRKASFAFKTYVEKK